jgi:protein involved in polysaccharide export with SLBB domain
MHPLNRRLIWIASSIVPTMALCGCAAMQPPDPPQMGPIVENAMSDAPVGRELDKVTHPIYTIEPPDTLTIEAVRIVPRSPYRIRPLDAIQVIVEGTLPDQPINGIFFVDPGGAINLGPAYGKVVIGLLPLEEAAEAVERHLRRTLKEPQVSLTLADAAGLQPITGQHQVGPDGSVNLGTYGKVPVTGLTIEQATERIEEHLSQYLEQPEVSIDIFNYASKNFYVITAGAGNGDNVQRFPITGNETVLDAIAGIQGLSRVSSKNIWIARPAPAGNGCDQILPVKIDAIVKGGNASTNYQLMPGDRLYIEGDHWVASESFINRIINPFERVLGTTLLGINTTQTMQRFPGGLQN